VNPRAELDDLEKILDHTGDTNSDPSVVQSVASRYTDYARSVNVLNSLNVNKFFGCPRPGRILSGAHDSKKVKNWEKLVFRVVPSISQACFVILCIHG
jgi:hypothetical protein